MSDYGFRISATGVDVKTGSDKDMVVTSKYSMLKGSFSGSGVVSVPQNGTRVNVNITHGLGHIPMVQGFWNDRDGDVFDPTFFYPLPTYLFTTVEYAFSAKADSTNVTLSFSIDDFGSGGSAIDIKYAYYIFIDKGKL